MQKAQKAQKADRTDLVWILGLYGSSGPMLDAFHTIPTHCASVRRSRDEDWHEVSVRMDASRLEELELRSLWRFFARDFLETFRKGF